MRKAAIKNPTANLFLIVRNMAIPLCRRQSRETGKSASRCPLCTARPCAAPSESRSKRSAIAALPAPRGRSPFRVLAGTRRDYRRREPVRRIAGYLDLSTPRHRAGAGRNAVSHERRALVNALRPWHSKCGDPLWPLALHQGLEPLILRRSRRAVLPRPCALVLNVVLYCITTATGQPRTLPAKRISVIGPGPSESLFQRGDDLAQPISRAERPRLTKQVLRAATTLAMGHLSQIETLEGIPVARRSNRHTALPFRSGPAF